MGRAGARSYYVESSEFHVVIETVDSRVQRYHKCPWEVQNRCDYSIEKWVGFGGPTTVEDFPAEDEEEQAA